MVLTDVILAHGGYANQNGDWAGQGFDHGFISPVFRRSSPLTLKQLFEHEEVISRRREATDETEHTRLGAREGLSRWLNQPG